MAMRVLKNKKRDRWTQKLAEIFQVQSLLLLGTVRSRLAKTIPVFQPWIQCVTVAMGSHLHRTGCKSFASVVCLFCDSIPPFVTPEMQFWVKFKLPRKFEYLLRSDDVDILKDCLNWLSVQQQNFESYLRGSVGSYWGSQFLHCN